MRHLQELHAGRALALVNNLRLLMSLNRLFICMQIIDAASIPNLGFGVLRVMWVMRFISSKSHLQYRLQFQETFFGQSQFHFGIVLYLG